MGALMRWLLLAVLISLAAVALAALALDRYMEEPLPLQAPQAFEIASGGSLSSVAGDLARQGLLEHPRWFVLFGRIKGLSSRLQAGEYLLEPGLTREDLLSRFRGRRRAVAQPHRDRGLDLQSDAGGDARASRAAY